MMIMNHKNREKMSSDVNALPCLLLATVLAR